MGGGRARVMVVEDDAAVRTVVGDYLRAAGYDVSLYSEGVSAREALRADLPDVLVVDRMLPGVTGDDLCREVRRSSDLPVIMLTALGAVEQRIRGLERGADDYVTKPFALKELRLRVDAQLRRRTPASPADAFTVGDFRIDPGRRRAWRGGEEIALTSREYELLLYCVQHPDQVLARDDLLGEVWGWSFGDTSTVTVHVRRLREKVEPEPRYPVYLRTEWGVGYRFTPRGDA
ncbi:response regulator transcription factor [Krasilnikoviella flava]|uniref:DNA-binding response regulator, OmpR family, contains REC and winged-helix (WHTH) domain n=1 Tax=Krasilnikoviella flava TaxID=526729 RepID=A0A1T5IEX3_9MICO|nr:response regulator transcription factor [Krasilnikoviella flava]SKC37655.1 DNA-binding response regulator, OmpR family, contains REC and winged-helix (wHTH) domain [Krasilnikoviella flava]